VIALAKISERYLSTMKIPLSRGRQIDAADVASGRSVALISQAAARRHWPGSDAVGARVTLDEDGRQSEPIEIVGIVGDVRNSDVDQPPIAQIYLPISLSPSNTLSFAVRASDADSARLAPAVREAVGTLDNEQPIFALKTMTQVIFDDLSGTLLLVSVLMAIALISLSIAAAGVYGLTAYSVTRRTREIGLRIALGAAPGAVVQLIVFRNARPVVIGALVGTAAAIALGTFASSAIGEANFTDPVNYIGVVSLLVVIAIIASIVPAQVAARIHPATALRSQ
jgi:hypothetical protein